MSGRGRGATLPAWMTAAGGAECTNGSNGSNGSAGLATSHSYQETSVPQYNQRAAGDDGVYSIGGQSIGDVGRYDDSNERSRRGTKRSRSRSHPRRNGRADGGRDRHESSTYVWRPRDKSIRNFDVKPPDGVELPPIGVKSTPNGVPNSFYSYANPTNPNPAPPPPQFTFQPTVPKIMDSGPSMQTRHARRLYAGGIPPKATEVEVMAFFNDIVTRALGANAPSSAPVIKIYLNQEKCYAFIEFSTIELATACMQLDGIKYEHHTGTTLLRVRRPNDYKPETLPPPGPIPTLSADVLGAAGATSASGPGKIFIGGLPYNLTDEQVMELLGAFGPIKAFHQVREPGSVTSKGYGFCEYANPETAEAAIAGLNGMQLGDKTLTVRVAVPSSNTASSSAQQKQLQQQMLASGMPGALGPMGAMGLMGGAAGFGMPGVGMGMGAAGMQGIYGGMGAPPIPAALGAYSAPAPPPPAVPTKVLQLSNMVTAADLADEAEYQDIIEDVRLECVEFGPVLKVLIPRARDGYPPAAEGFIYVHFSAADAAQAAFAALNGRKFASNTVVVRYFDEVKFGNGILL